MSDVLVVGGSSFIGRHLLPRLAASGHHVVATHHRGVPSPIAGVEWVASDLGAVDVAAGWPSRCETVVYLAQSRARRNFPDGARDVFAVNVHGVFRAAEYARAAGARRIVFASTGTVYGGNGPATEDTPIDVAGERPFDVAAKLSAELLLQPYASALAVVILRLFVPYGPGQDPSMLIPQIIRKVREGQPVLLDGEDGLRANPVAAEDVAEAIERTLACDRSLTLNVAGPEVLSLREMAGAIGRETGREPRFERRETRAGSFIGDVARLGRTLGWTPRARFDEGLRRWLPQAAVAGREG